MVKENKDYLDSVAIVLDIFEQVDTRFKGQKQSLVDNEKDEMQQTMVDDHQHPHEKVKIITIDNFSDEEDSVS